MQNEKQEQAEKLDQLTTQIDAVLALADCEHRGLSDDETAKLADLEKQADEIETALKKQKAEDDLRGRQLARKNYLEAPPQAPPTRLEPTRNLGQPEFKVPIEAKRYGKLRHFTDERGAYLSGMWIRGNLLGDGAALSWMNDSTNGVQNLTLIGADNAKGGLFVPEVMLQTVIDLREEYGVFRRKVRVQPMSSDTITIPRRLSGPTVYFVGEETATTASNLAWNQVQLTCRTLAALTLVSKELADDATIDIASTVVEQMAYAMAVKEDQCGFLGTGTSTYGGISGLITELTTATASTVTAATANTAYSTLDLTDFEGMIGKLPAFPGIRPEWYIHKAGWAASMMRLADAAGGNTADIIEGKRQEQFLGYPVNFVPSMNSTLTAQTSTYGLCYFGDLSMAATMGDRRGIEVATTTERYFEYRQVGIQAVERFDINIHDVGDTSSAGAMIMLATPAS